MMLYLFMGELLIHALKDAWRDCIEQSKINYYVKNLMRQINLI